MNKNSWLDMWLVIPRGQRRVIIVLLCVVAILLVAQVVVTVCRNNHQEPATDYSVLEQEISDFRSHLDTIPLDERRPTYVRRTTFKDDTARQQKPLQSVRKRSGKRQQHHERKVEPTPRIDDDVRP